MNRGDKRHSQQPIGAYLAADLILRVDWKGDGGLEEVKEKTSKINRKEEDYKVPSPDWFMKLISTALAKYLRDPGLLHPSGRMNAVTVPSLPIPHFSFVFQRHMPPTD
jgi:hypothetical protein